MSLLWTKVAAYAEDHDEHHLNPAFEAAGIKPGPCGFSLCHDADWDHSDAFDEAERRFFNGEHKPERISLAEPVYGFEHTADMHTIRRYTKHPESRKGPITMFRHQGKHYLFNGHHGTAAALRRGDSHLDVEMVDLDKD